MKRIAALVAVPVTALAAAAHAYTLVIAAPDGVPRRWQQTSQPIVFQINQDTGPGLPNIEAGSNPMAAIEHALSSWPAAANIQFSHQQTAVESVGGDGINVITVKNTTPNRMALEMAGSPLGLTLVRSQGNNIIEADIVFNAAEGFSTTRETDADLTQVGRHDLEAVAAHELGHAIGLHHTGVEGATMWSLSSVLQRSLDSDDRAGARSLYPVGPSGTIRGQVDADSSPLFGAHVVALRDGIVAASALTLPDGSYAIRGIDAGTYTVYVEPLDGPHATVPDDPCTRIGNISGGGIYGNAVLDTDFATAFFGGNTTPTAVQVIAGGEATVSFALTGGAIALNPTLIGPAVVSGGGVSLSVGGNPVPLIAGQRQAIAVAGPALDTVAEVGISAVDSAITLVPGSLRQLSLNCNGTNLPTIVFEVNTAQTAISGLRSLLLRRGTDVSLMTGAIDVRGVEPTTPTPTVTSPPPSATPTGSTGTCVGDCDGGGTVTVDEIVTMVNIALGLQPVAGCLAADSDASGTVTVDEILTAIGAALNGC